MEIEMIFHCAHRGQKSLAERRVTPRSAACGVFALTLALSPNLAFAQWEGIAAGLAAGIVRGMAGHGGGYRPSGGHGHYGGGGHAQHVAHSGGRHHEAPRSVAKAPDHPSQASQSGGSSTASASSGPGKVAY
jgi:hypothetical protein